MAACMDELAVLTQINSHLEEHQWSRTVWKHPTDSARKKNSRREFIAYGMGASRSLINLLPVKEKDKKLPSATSSSWLPISNSLLELSRLHVTCFSAAFCLPFLCFPRETALSHPRSLLPRLSAPNPRAQSAAHFASFSLKVSQGLKKAHVLISEFMRGQTENASRDAGDEANGRCGEWQVCSCGMLWQIHQEALSHKTPRSLQGNPCPSSVFMLLWIA